MISDEADEDAAVLEDETALDSYLADAPTPSSGGTPDMTCLPDWPPMPSRAVDLKLDGETLAWFQAIHADWRRAMQLVLRGWVAAKRARHQSTPQTIHPDVAPGRPEDRP